MSEITEKGKKRREKVIACADKLLRKHGYEDMTLRMLAQEVGISRGHLGHYFAEKKDILYELSGTMLRNLWTGSVELCGEWNDPYKTYAFSVHWFFLICSQLSDIRRIMFQSLKHWDIQREFSNMYADWFILLLEQGVEQFDRDRLLVYVQMSFAAQFNYICSYEESLTDERSSRGSDLHIRTLFMLLGFGDDNANAANQLVRERICELTAERLLLPFTRDYNWYRLEGHPFKV